MYTILSKEVWKSNFQQYGEMEKQRWEQSEKRRERVRRKKMQVCERVESGDSLCFSNNLWLRRVEK